MTSFSGKYGRIQYFVRAVVERPKLPDQSVRRELQVISHVDVNTPALLVSPPPSSVAEPTPGHFGPVRPPLPRTVPSPRRSPILPVCSEAEQVTNRVLPQDAGGNARRRLSNTITVTRTRRALLPSGHTHGLGYPQPPVIAGWGAVITPEH